MHPVLLVGHFEHAPIELSVVAVVEVVADVVVAVVALVFEFV